MFDSGDNIAPGLGLIKNVSLNYGLQGHVIRI